MIMFEVLNPIVQACVVKVVGFVVGFGDSIKKDNIFSMGTFMEKSSCALVVVEMYLFKRFLYPLLHVLIL